MIRRRSQLLLAWLAAGALLVAPKTIAGAARLVDEPVTRAVAAQATPPGPTQGVQVTAGTIQGVVANGTTGAASPNGLAVTLNGYDNFVTSVTMTTTTDSAGAFAFRNVPNVAGRYYMLAVPYAGVPYSSDLLKFDPNAKTLNTKVQVYETTADASVLRIAQMQLVFDLAGDGATVTEICLLSNNSQRTFVASGGAGFTVPVPTGAAAVAVQTQQGSIAAERTAQGLQIKTPLLPGTGTAELMFTFRLLNQPVAFQQALPIAVDNLTVFVPDGGPTVQGASFQDGGKQTFQGKAYHAFGSANVTAGQKIAFQINGGAPTVRGPANPSLLIVIGLGLLNVGLVAAIGAMLWRQHAGPRRRAGGSTHAAPGEDGLDSPRAAG